MSKSQRQHIERALASVEADRAANPLNDADIDSLIGDMSSPDAAVRAAALRQSCPCHVSWDAFERLRKPAQRLRRDPDSEVRRVALHLEEDARELVEMAAQLERMRDGDEAAETRRAARSRRRGPRSR